MKKQTDFSGKPYNRCLTCQHRIEKRCDGPRTSAMTLERWCEFMRAMKEANDLTNAEIEKRSQVSIKTIERIMAINCDKDIMRDTARRIESAILGVGNQFPCYLAFEETRPKTDEELYDARRELARLLADNEDHRKALAGIHSSYKEEMQNIREEHKVLVNQLLDQIQAQKEQIRAQRDQISKLQSDKDNLWAENIRKSRVVDMFLEKQNVMLMQK